MRFRVHVPEYHNQAEMTLIVKDTIIRHVHKDNDGYKMAWAAQAYEWLLGKYGQPVRPWERTLAMKNERNNSAGQFMIDETSNHLWYCYVHTHGQTGQATREREPQNSIQIKDPATYNGALGRQGTDFYDKTDKVWIVNGRINKADGEFNQHFDCWQVGDTGIVLGRAPLHEGDVQRACRMGAVACLDIQTPREQGQRNTAVHRLEQLWRQVGVHAFVASEVEDDYEDEYCEQLFRAACELDKLLSQVDIPEGQGVFVHDTNAVTEAPGLVIVYLALFCRHEDWDDHPALLKYLRGFHKNVLPNMRIVDMTIEKYRKF